MSFTLASRAPRKDQRTWGNPIPTERVELSYLVFGPSSARVIKLHLRHAGLDDAWTERVHPNVGARELAGTGLGDRVHAGIGPLSEFNERRRKQVETHAALLALSVKPVSSSLSAAERTKSLTVYGTGS